MKIILLLLFVFIISYIYPQEPLLQDLTKDPTVVYCNGNGTYYYFRTADFKNIDTGMYLTYTNKNTVNGTIYCYLDSKPLFTSTIELAKRKYVMPKKEDYFQGINAKIECRAYTMCKCIAEKTTDTCTLYIGYNTKAYSTIDKDFCSFGNKITYSLLIIALFLFL